MNSNGQAAEGLAQVADQFRQEEVLKGFLEAMSEPVAILAPDRRLVWSNGALRALLQLDGAAGADRYACEVFGQRQCDGDRGGCGHGAAACSLDRVIEAGFAGLVEEREIQVERESGSVLFLRLRGTPIGAPGQRLVLLLVEDMSRQRRRDMLERVFFHDLINSLGAIQGASQMLQEQLSGEDGEMAWLLAEQAQEVLDEVHAHRDLFDAETDELRLRKGDVSALRLLKRMGAAFGAHQAFCGRQILLDPSAEDLSIRTDATLLRRIVGNMVKNALEASRGTVTLDCRADGDGVVLSVHNEGEIPAESRERIFRRAFTTKGIGRGLGCYSMKLFGEGVLGGRVWFTSAGEGGTRFCIRLPADPPEVV